MNFNQNKNNMNSPRTKLLLLALLPILFSSCKKVFELPAEKEYISKNLNYGSKFFEPILGRTTVFGNFNADNSTQPLTFKIVNARFGDGRPMTDLFTTKEVWVWTGEYDGKEKSLEEINAKRKKETKPLLEVRTSGQFILWASATDDLVTARKADSSHLVQNRRFFDVKVSNTGGEVILKDLELRLWRERAYEPQTDVNPYTGAVARNPIDPFNPKGRDYIRPNLSNVIGKVSRKALVSNDNIKDVVAYIRPFTGGNGHSLRFKFLNKDSVAINPALFNETKWDILVHGFNRVTTAEYVQYDVAYPIPLVNIPTIYASGGRANVNFSYSRIGFGGIRQTANIGLGFSIYREGDWEIVFHFKTDNPKFEDE